MKVQRCRDHQSYWLKTGLQGVQRFAQQPYDELVRVSAVPCSFAGASIYVAWQRCVEHPQTNLADMLHVAERHRWQQGLYGVVITNDDHVSEVRRCLASPS